MIADLLLVLAWIFLGFGVAGIFRLEGVYETLLSSSKIDSVVVLTVIISLMIRLGFSPMTLRLLILLVFYLATNPVSNQMIAASAYRGGLLPEKGGIHPWIR
ncbi:cation:proton antiporter [Acidaminobacter sp.]|uniref:cation:proton antiporter n=1 Tax=Acidaminobacter sp. TaxID=1872102 RepID=UPI00137EED33|nr:monovalent cation/H(+) antiporter subunit G [Acidaminobacter sp.]MDK9710417.1 monovalent cation/H(+) antiporter subunit G [Acidaminobacter sp.]MZQ96072.1 cation:proton antiporter [Acidaminobacter sp.]